jgi:hypothetical protein
MRCKQKHNLYHRTSRMKNESYTLILSRFAQGQVIEGVTKTDECHEPSILYQICKKIVCLFVCLFVCCRVGFLFLK